MKSLVVLVALLGCSNKDPGGGGAGSAPAPGSDAPEFFVDHVDCNRVLTPEMRAAAKLTNPRSVPYDEYKPSKTECASFTGPGGRHVSINFACSIRDVDHALDFSKRSPTAVVASIGKAAWVRSPADSILSVIDDNTDCAIDFQMFMDKDHLAGQALIDGLGPLPGAVVKQLTKDLFLPIPEVMKREKDRRRYDETPEVDCDGVVDEPARAAWPGGLAWQATAKHRKSGWKWACKELKEPDGKIVRVEVGCFRSRATAERHFELATGVAGATVALDQDTPCVVEVSYELMPSAELATRAAPLVEKLLANLTPARVKTVE